MRSIRRSTRLAAAAASAALLLAACGGEEDTPDAPPADDGAGADADGMDDGEADGMDGMDDGADEGMDDGEADGMDGMDDGDASADLTAAPFGAACEEIPADGPGSSEGMAADPAATAASNNPVLETLVDFVGQADLAETINGLEDVTILAPSNDAFAALDPDVAEAVTEDTALLADVLTYHVVEGEMDAQQLIDGGEGTTLFEGQDPLTFSEGGTEGVVVEAAGNEANVICGNVETANATVHIIDQVLLPDLEG